jgi:hypothetical protein
MRTVPEPIREYGRTVLFEASDDGASNSALDLAGLKRDKRFDIPLRMTADDSMKIRREGADNNKPLSSTCYLAALHIRRQGTANTTGTFASGCHPAKLIPGFRV